MTASSRRRSLIGRSGGAQRKSDRRSVTAPLRIGKDTKLTIEELEALAIEDFPDEDDDDDDDYDDVDLDGEDDDAPFEDDLGAEPMVPLGLPIQPHHTPLEHTPLDVIERGVPGQGHQGAEADDTYVLDDPPSEEVRKDPRFVGIDFGADEPAQVETVKLPRPTEVSAPTGGPRTTPSPAPDPVSPPPAEEEPRQLRLFGMAAALLGSGSVAVIVVCVLVGGVAAGSLVLGSRWSGPEVPVVAATPPEPLPEPVAEPTPVESTEPEEVEPEPEPEVVVPVPRRRPRPEPVVVVEPEPVVVPEPPPPPRPAPVVVEAPEEDKRGLFGKKKKK